MEYIPGVTLGDKLAQTSLPEKQVIALGAQLAEGLSAAHEHSVIHRDLKPGNLRITTDGRLKILDFGLAKLRASVAASPVSETLSATHAIVGTLPYMAPMIRFLFRVSGGRLVECRFLPMAATFLSPR